MTTWGSGSRRFCRLCIALTLVVIVGAACGGGDGEADETAGASSVESDATPSEAVGEPILMLTRMKIPTGKILDGSTIGDEPFCPGGTVKDKHGDPEEIGALVDRTITCSDGTLRVGFSPQEPVGDTQSGPWKIISGTGAYEEWQGSGQMTMTYEPGSDTYGNEEYTGTVTR